MKIKPTSNRGRVIVEMNRRDGQLLAASSRETKSAPFKLKNILVPIDFSDYSKRALQYALPFAEKYGAKLVLLHVVEPSFYPENYFDVLIPAEMEQVNMKLATTSRKRLAELRRQEVDPDIASDILVKIGKPHAEIIQAVREHDIDLVIIATHGYTGLKHVFLGSTAERVVRHASCPVLTVR